MTERDAFLRAIAANLYDDTPRLAFADWLDEHGEHDRAEFIRVQCELEPIRDRYEIPRAAELHEREEQFGAGKHVKDPALGWLGAMPEGWNNWDVGISIEFRRGFLDIVALSAKTFLEHGAAVRALHPSIRRVVIHCLNGWGERLAACATLNGLAELELACWYSDDDMKALGASPHLADLQVLELWTGRQREVGTDANLCKLAAKAPAWSKLRELVLLDPEGDNEKRVKRLVTSVNRVAKRKIGRYERGYPELFPLNGEFYSDLPLAGRLPDGRAAVLERGATPVALQVRTFDAAGAPTGEEIDVPVPPELAHAIGKGANWGGKHIQIAQAALGFEPGFIRVQENALGDDLGPWRGHGNDWNRCGLPDDPEDPTDYNGDPHPNGIGGEISWAVRGGEFVVGYSGWADKTGQVHST
jgi:uncharacterized protein (TIGR02996 family)